MKECPQYFPVDQTAELWLSETKAGDKQKMTQRMKRAKNAANNFYMSHASLRTCLFDASSLEIALLQIRTNNHFVFF